MAAERKVDVELQLTSEELERLNGFIKKEFSKWFGKTDLLKVLFFCVNAINEDGTLSIAITTKLGIDRELKALEKNGFFQRNGNNQLFMDPKKKEATLQQIKTMAGKETQLLEGFNAKKQTELNQVQAPLKAQGKQLLQAIKDHAKDEAMKDQVSEDNFEFKPVKLEDDIFELVRSLLKQGATDAAFMEAVKEAVAAEETAEHFREAVKNIEIKAIFRKKVFRQGTSEYVNTENMINFFQELDKYITNDLPRIKSLQRSLKNDLERKATLGKNGEALIDAAKRGNAQLVESLLTQGATEAAKSEALMQVAEKAVAALHEREFGRYVFYQNTIQLFINAKVAIKEIPQQDTVLHKAVCGSNPTISFMNLLIQARADVNARNQEGDTPLHKATRNIAAFQWLLAHGADPNIKNSQGKTVVEVLQEEVGVVDTMQIRKEIILLLHHGVPIDRFSAFPLVVRRYTEHVWREEMNSASAQLQVESKDDGGGPLPSASLSPSDALKVSVEAARSAGFYSGTSSSVPAAPAPPAEAPDETPPHTPPKPES